MSSTSRKTRNFVAEPMGEKPVTALPGIGEVLGSRLESKGYTKANAVFGQFLVRGQNKESFQGWLKETCHANTKQSNDCYESLREWGKVFL